MADKEDDFDEWLDDIDDIDGELNQDNIDALFNAVEQTDTSLQNQVTVKKTSGELDQDNIDVLLGLKPTISAAKKNGKDAGIAELDQDNIDSLLSGTGYDAGASGDFSLDELEQDNIDALIARSSDLDAAVPDTKNAELAQDNIDALLADSNKDAGSQAASQNELNQDDIDSLFSSDSTSPQSTGGPDLDALFAGDDGQQASSDADQLTDLDQNNIDALFNTIDADSGNPSKEEDNSLDTLFTDDKKEATVAVPDQMPQELSPEDAEDLAASAFAADLDDMDNLFADINASNAADDPFLSEEIDFAEMLGQTAGDNQEFIELDAADNQGHATKADDFMALAGAEDDSDIVALPKNMEKEEKSVYTLLPASLTHISKTALAGIGAGLALLLLIGLYFLFSGPTETMDDTQRVASVPVPVVQQAPAPKMAENFIPVTEDALYTMGSESGELAIALTATDQDDQPLIYEITAKPRHGRLSGIAPHLTYLPDNTFPGEDRFEFTASDGTDTSKLAVVMITGPDLATMAMAKKNDDNASIKDEAEKKILQPQKPKVLAIDVEYLTNSTGAVTIDWARLWQEANNSPYAPQEVHVEIVATALKGALTRADQTNHIFTPDPYTAHTNTIRYRFKKGGFRSATQMVTINVELGSPPPEINIAKLADNGYMVGQNVIIDASGSRDEARDSLQFSWQQLAGVRVDLQPINKEGSKIAFTMPSSFYSEPNPGPTIVVTAVDNTGKEVHKELKIKMISRRQTALWRGENGSIAPDPPMQGSYFPWPFDD